MTRKALGRGLGALIPDPASSREPFLEIDLDLIDPNPLQPRTPSNRGDLNGLIVSIRENGVVQPILVRRHHGRYQLVAGERRWLAAQGAGLLKIPAVIRDIPDEKLLEQALIENIQRQELTPIEEAQAYQRLMADLDLTQEQVAGRVGKDRVTITNALRLLKLPASIREWVHQGSLGMGHARALLGLGSEKQQLELARKIIQSGLSVRVVEQKVKRLAMASREESGHGKESPGDPNVAAAAARLRERFGTKVEIVGSPKRGRIILHYFNSEELDRLFEKLIS